MLHSKIYYFDMPGGTVAAFVGSHNLTGFALRGMNGEAAVLLEGPAADPAFADIRAHIEEAYRTAHPYDASLKEAYARWYADYLDRLRVDISDMPRDGTGGRTLVILAEAAAGTVPVIDQALYFEIDTRIERVRAIEAEVHLYLFRQLPASPRAGLAATRTAAHAFRARVQAIDARAGSAEINADWFIEQAAAAELKRAPRPFRPKLRAGKQQVTVQITDTLAQAFEYGFEGPSRWLPKFGPDTMVDEETDEAWSPVVGFHPERDPPAPARRGAQELMELSPDSGSYILLSHGRRRLNG